ncbi:MAG: TRAP transporter large permease [Pseudoxanthomonas sp.]
MMSFTAVSIFLLLMLAGLPLAFALGLGAALAIGFYDLPLAVVAQRTVNAIDSTALMAVPMFILAANLFNATGITGHLFDLIRMIVGRLRGGLGHVTVLANLVFSGISGAALADIGALGNVQMKMMREQGYSDRFGAGLSVAAATIGPIFPPSIPLIIFAAAAEVSAVKLLLAGVVPGLLIALALMIQVAWMARGGKLPRDTSVRLEAAALRKKLLVATPALLAPVILLGGLVSGWFGPTEIAAVTVVYASFLGVFVYRTLTWTRFVAAARESVQTSASVMLIVGTAALFAWVLTIDQLPMLVSEYLLSISKNPLILLLLVNLLLLMVGMVMETLAAILILAPILTPALVAAGVDPIQLGVVVVLNLMIGLMTPPVGMSLYMMSLVARIPVHHVLLGCAPFLVPLFVALALITLVPELSTWLPNLIFAK